MVSVLVNWSTTMFIKDEAHMSQLIIFIDFSNDIE